MVDVNRSVKERCAAKCDFDKRLKNDFGKVTNVNNINFCEPFPRVRGRFVIFPTLKASFGGWPVHWHCKTTTSMIKIREKREK